MNKIFIESRKPETPEYQFLETYITSVLAIASSQFSIYCVNGKDNLWNVAPQFQEAEITGGNNLVIFDADTPLNGGGYEKRKHELTERMRALNLHAALFLFPNNHDDGIFENVLEHMMLYDKHHRFLDCFSDYESCLGDQYVHPNLKSKVFSYISSMKDLPNSKRKLLGSGKWQFDNPSYWDMTTDYLDPLKDFLKENLTTDNYR